MTIVAMIIAMLSPNEGRHPALTVRPGWGTHPGPCARVAITGPAKRPTEIERYAYDGEHLRTAEQSAAGPGAPPLRRVVHHRGEGGRLLKVEVLTKEFADSPWDTEVSRYRYDDAGRLVAIESSSDDGRSITGRVEHGYDASGRRIRDALVSAAGKVVHEDVYQLDAQGRPVRQVHSIGEPPEAQWTIDFAWDAQGRLESERHSRDGTTRYLYDAAGRMTQRERKHGKPGKVTARTTFELDAAGRVTAEVVETFGWPKPKVVRFEYDYACWK